MIKKNKKMDGKRNRKLKIQSKKNMMRRMPKIAKVIEEWLADAINLEKITIIQAKIKA